MKITDFFNEDIRKLMTDETLTAIEEAVETRINLAVDEALVQQDETYAAKLETLVTTIDESHSKKMLQILEASDKDKTAKLVKVVKLNKRREENDLRKFKKTLIESVGAFIDEFISETISPEDLQQAVNNKSAYRVLEQLRQTLAIDTAMINKSIVGALTDGKGKMDQLQKENTNLQKNLELFKEQNEKFKKDILLESKLSTFKSDKKEFIKKALADKSLKFIEENLDYTAKLFDRNQKKTLQTLKESALDEREHKPDFVPSEKVVNENVNNKEASDQYVSELSKVGRFH